jgi:hypothetical protein
MNELSLEQQFTIRTKMDACANTPICELRVVIEANFAEIYKLKNLITQTGLNTLTSYQKFNMKTLACMIQTMTRPDIIRLYKSILEEKIKHQNLLKKFLQHSIIH